MKSKVVRTKLAQGKQKFIDLTLLLDCIPNHNKKRNNLYKCTSNHVSTEKKQDLNQIYTFMIFQDDRHSISVLFT